MSHSLNSFKEVTCGIIWGTTIGVMIKGDTRSLDYSSYENVCGHIVMYMATSYGLYRGCTGVYGAYMWEICGCSRTC